MAFDEKLASRIRDLLDPEEFVEKRMFGGVAFLFQGNMCVCVWKEFLIVRLGEQQAASALKLPNVYPFDVTGKAMKGWAMVEKTALAGPEDLKQWVFQAVDFVDSLPPKDSQKTR